MLPLLLHSSRPKIIHNRPRRRHDHALLDPKETQTIKTYVTINPRLRCQRNVAIQRSNPAVHAQIQRLCTGPPILRRILHNKSRKVRVVPSAMRYEPNGSPKSNQDGRVWAELWRVRGV